MNQNWKALVKKKMKPRKHKQILRGWINREEMRKEMN